MKTSSQTASNWVDRLTASPARWAWLVLAVSLFAFCNVFAWYPGDVVTHGVNFRKALTWELLRWNLWLPLAALMLRLAAYFPFSPVGMLAMLHYRPYVLTVENAAGGGVQATIQIPYTKAP